MGNPEFHSRMGWKLSNRDEDWITSIPFASSRCWQQNWSSRRYVRRILSRSVLFNGFFSPNFRFRVIQLYPNGRLESGRGNLSVYIKSIKAATNKTLKICFDHRSRIKPFIKPVNELLDGWGYPKFISHAQLFGSCKRMFADGKLIIRCVVSCSEMHERHEFL